MINQNDKIKSNKKTSKHLKRSDGKNNFFIISSIIILVFFITAYFFINMPGQVIGRVMDSTSDSPLTGVKINLDNKKDFENNNVTGGFIINDVSPGEHILTFSKDG